MKIYTEVVYQYNRSTKEYDRVSEVFEDYEGQMAWCGGGGKGGGGGGYSPPPAPDPAAVAAAQGQQDRKTAQTNALLLNPSIVNPYGTIGYDVNDYTIDGDNIKRPTQTTTLSPAEQRLLEDRNVVSGLLSKAGIGLANDLPGTKLIAPGTPQRPDSINYDNVSPVPSMNDYSEDAQKAAKSYYDQQYSLLAPDSETQRKALENRLIQTGNPLGSEAYGTEMDRYQRQRDAGLSNLSNAAVSQGYNLQNQLFNNANTARQQQIAMNQLPYNTANQIRQDTISENQLLRNQQINELSALLQGREAISLPVGAQYNQQALTPPDIAGMTYQGYNNQLNSYNQMYSQQQQQGYNSGNAFTSGLFSLGSAGLGLFG